MLDRSVKEQKPPKSKYEMARRVSRGKAYMKVDISGFLSARLFFWMFS